VVRTSVGEINVVEGLRKNKCAFGGEGNGGVIYPKVLSSRDSLTGMALVLALMTGDRRPLSKIVADFPSYIMIKTKIACANKEQVDEIMEKARKVFAKAKLDTRDGIRASFGSSWIHVRPSNTEPVVRIIAEARTKAEVQKLIGKLGGN
jgi:phosphomannomutase